jgi:hypothetical protein
MAYGLCMHLATLCLSLSLLLLGCGSSRERPEDGGTLDVGMDSRSGDANADADAGADAGGDASAACDGLNEPECIGRGGCVPTYDDRCCSTCTPGAGCADCTDVRFHSCVPRDTCGSDICGVFSMFWCGDLSTVCPDRFEDPQECLMAPGCVTATDPTCAPDCDPQCVGVYEDSCAAASCDEPAPTCPAGQRPVVTSGCYTGLCMPADVCE